MMFTSAARNADAEASSAAFVEEDEGGGAEAGAEICCVATGDTAGVLFFCCTGVVVACVSGVLEEAETGERTGRDGVGPGTIESVDDAVRGGGTGDTTGRPKKVRIKIPNTSAAAIPRWGVRRDMFIR